MPVKLDAKMSRKAAIITGNISENRGTIHAYIVFREEPAALAALASNMHLVHLDATVSTFTYGVMLLSRWLFLYGRSADCIQRLWLMLH